MRAILKSYFFWAFPRGSFHYDVMVTLILAFIFLSPLLINYRERPQATRRSSSEVLVETPAANTFVYEISGEQIQRAADATALQAELLKRIQEISGVVEIDAYDAQKDARGRVVEYRVWAHRAEPADAISSTP